MKTIENLLEESEFFKGLAPEHIRLIAGCARNVQYKPDEFVFREGDDSSQFYVLRAGRIALEINVPGKGPMIIQTLMAGDVLSWSWIIPPYKKNFDARAMEITRATAFDGECIRQKCEKDSLLGYELYKRFATVVGQRLHSTRLQLLDLYATTG